MSERGEGQRGEGGLRIEPNIADPDAFYEALIDLHRGLDEARSAEVHAALVLLLANHIGDAAVLGEAMRRARATVDRAAPARDGHGAPTAGDEH